VHDSLEAETLLVAPVITALVAAIGQVAPALPRRLYPLLAIALGIAWVSAAEGRVDTSCMLEGIVAGLAACGLYSAAVKPAAGALEARLGAER
jgi:hypothetical protein